MEVSAAFSVFACFIVSYRTRLKQVFQTNNEIFMDFSRLDAGIGVVIGHVSSQQI